MSLLSLVGCFSSAARCCCSASKEVANFGADWSCQPLQSANSILSQGEGPALLLPGLCCPLLLLLCCCAAVLLCAVEQAVRCCESSVESAGGWVGPVSWFCPGGGVEVVGQESRGAPRMEGLIARCRGAGLQLGPPVVSSASVKMARFAFNRLPLARRQVY